MPEGRGTTRLVFVYGTLRRGECNDITRYAPAPIHVGEGETPGTLYHLGPYPGAVFGGSARVVGEVYRVTPAVEALLDALEGVQADGEGEYRRREVPVRVQGRVLWCLAYEIHPSRLPGRPCIECGDWLCRPGAMRLGMSRTDTDVA